MIKLKLNFPVTNNVAEYEALLACLSLAKKIQIKETNIQLIARQLSGKYQTHDPLLQLYCDKASTELVGFPKVANFQIPREENSKANFLLKLAVSKKALKVMVFFEQKYFPSCTLTPTVLFINDNDWRTSIVSYLKGKALPETILEKIRKRATRYMLIEDEIG